MKQLFWLLIFALSVMLLSFQSFAAEQIVCNVEVNSDDIIISGSLPVKYITEVSIMVINEGKTIDDLAELPMIDVIKYQDQTTTKSDGSFVFSFVMHGNPGDYSYKIYTKGFDFTYYGTLKFYGSQYVNHILNQINGCKNDGNSTLLEDLINTYYNDLYLKSDIFMNYKSSGGDMENLFGILIEMDNVNSTVELGNQLDEAALLCEIQFTDESDTARIIQENKEKLNLNNNTAFNSFIDTDIVSSEDRVMICKSLSKEYKSIISFVNDFQSKVILYVANNAGSWGRLMRIIIDNKGIIGIDINKYNALSTPEEVFLTMLGKTYNSVEEIKNVFNDTVNNAQKSVEKDKQKASGGTSGGWRSGGSPASVSGERTEDVKKDIFVDLKGYEWAKDSIEDLYNSGIINGKDAGRYAPADNVTREEFVKLLVSVAKLYDRNAECKFSDTDKNEWYYGYIASAVSAGIVNGKEDNSFGVGEHITREDMATLAFRLVSKLNSDTNHESYELGFSDADEISNYAKNAVAYMQSIGVILGTGDNLFSPRQFTNRAQAAVVIYRLKNALNLQ